MKSNILVVDDNDLNIELVIQLLENYKREKNSEINIFTATNGQEAVEVCNNENIDLVFMDLMMPVMDGNEATIEIKKSHPGTMIIVISSIGDEKHQKKMLLNGAEDYITKPITAPVFNTRLNNYIQLIEHRNHISNSIQAKNLFTSKVYSYHMEFNILSEEHLSEFWEAMLIRLDFQSKIEHISDFVRFLYSLGSLQLKQKFKFKIYIEEDLTGFYFTLDNINFIGCPRVEKLIETHFKDAIYTCSKNHLTFLLPKSSLDVDSQPQTNQEAAINQISTTDKPVFQTKEVEELKTYDVLDEDDLLNVEECLLKINSIVLLMENSKLEYDEIDDLCNYFEQIASILSIPNDTYVISNSLYELTNSISNNIEYFNENANMLFEFTRAFINDLFFWKTKIFYEGAPSVDFLNDSITTNANMLKTLINHEDQSNVTVDDIFDF